MACRVPAEKGGGTGQSREEEQVGGGGKGRTSIFFLCFLTMAVRLSFCAAVTMPFSGCGAKGKQLGRQQGAAQRNSSGRNARRATHDPLLGVEDHARQELGPLEARLLARREHLLEDGVDDVLVGGELLQRVALLGRGDVLAGEEVAQVGLVQGRDAERLARVRVGVDGEVAEDCAKGRRRCRVRPAGAATKRARRKENGLLAPLYVDSSFSSAMYSPVCVVQGHVQAVSMKSGSVTRTERSRTHPS